MSLLDRNGDKADAWRRADVPGAQTQVIVPLADLVTTLASGNQIVGVEIANTSRVDELAPHFDRLGLIAIAFPSFSDGRGFSIARTLRNAGYSQPYYVRHDYAQLRRGEAAAFIKTYYNQFSALADRETYTFWEHYFGASPHKTHEEGWFLMQTRWMLWLEDGATLRLLTGVPRAWLEQGKAIKLEKVASYFGKLSLTVNSQVRAGCIEAEVKFHEPARKPRQVMLRLPHPLGSKAVRCTGGKYDAQTETVTVAGNGKVVLEF